MKKTFIGLLVIAVAGAGLYYFLQKSNPVQKKFLVGQWKMDSLVPVHDSTRDGLAVLMFAIDSYARNEVYDFRDDGKIHLYYPNDSLNRSDTNSYQWIKSKHFVWLDEKSNQPADTMQVLKLSEKELILRTKDSTRIHFSKR